MVPALHQQLVHFLAVASIPELIGAGALKPVAGMVNAIERIAISVVMVAQRNQMQPWQVESAIFTVMVALPHSPLILPAADDVMGGGGAAGASWVAAAVASHFPDFER